MIWSIHHRDHWKDLKPLEEPTDMGRRLGVGGFILADPFEELLRRISAEYLSEAWNKLSKTLTAHDLAPVDLSWGFLHPGETYVSGKTSPLPSDFIGWTSRQLANFDNEDDRFMAIDQELKIGNPALRFVFTWRSLKWRIAPNSYDLGLRLVEALWTDETTDWSPDRLLENIRQPTEPWLRVAQAIQENDQLKLNRSLADAKASYSPLGYRILIRGYTAYVDEWKERFRLRLHLP